ncbi:MAG: class I SAM-dependent rRNA methyltransferase [Flavobacteriales bacterium]|nr:class I SAM-dependent rRNA methyltransferase [Flavobacteriales bacterium]
MNPRITLKKGKDRALRNFHPWVFSGALGRVPPNLQNGDVVDVFSYEDEFLGRGFYGSSSIAARIMTFKDEAIDQGFWESRFQSALALRNTLGFPSAKTNAFRWIHGEGDGLPGLIVDVYGPHLVMQAHHTGIRKNRETIAQALLNAGKVLGIETIYDKSADTLQGQEAGENAWLHGDTASTEILENGHRFLVNWVEGQKTGFFLDQRDNRQLLASLAKGRHLLNAYAYSGGFSVYGAMAGAASVHSVDSSEKAMDLAGENMKLNKVSCPHQEHVSEVGEFLKSSKDKFDLIVLDPPAFAKRLSALENGLRGYRNINSTAFKKILPGGILFTFSCSQAVSPEAFQQVVFQAASESGRFVRILHRLSQPADHPVNIYHPEGSYLKGLVLEVE